MSYVGSKLKIELIYDLPQYDFSLKPLEDELRTRGHKLFISRTRGRERNVDCSVSIQGVGAKSAYGVRFHITHGISPIKGWRVPQGIDVFLAPTIYWEREAIARDSNTRYDVIFTNGWPKMDVLFKLKENRNSVRDEIFERFKLSNTKPLVVYFPTYKKLNKSKKYFRRYKIGDVTKILGELPVNFIVVPHIMDSTNEVYSCKNIYNKYDITRQKIMAASDLMITDVSGILFEYTIFNKPIVILTNAKDNHPTITSVLGIFRKEVNAGPIVTIDSLCTAVMNSIENPSLYETRRLYFKELIVGPCDGKHSSRTADAIEMYMERTTRTNKLNNVRR